jgi:hypothetical protein
MRGDKGCRADSIHEAGCRGTTARVRRQRGQVTMGWRRGGTTTAGGVTTICNDGRGGVGRAFAVVQRWPVRGDRMGSESWGSDDAASVMGLASTAR